MSCLVTAHNWIIRSFVTVLSRLFPDTPHYIAMAEVPFRIAMLHGKESFDSTLKYLVALREPVSRAVSSWIFKTHREELFLLYVQYMPTYSVSIHILNICYSSGFLHLRIVVCYNETYMKSEEVVHFRRLCDEVLLYVNVWQSHPNVIISTTKSVEIMMRAPLDENTSTAAR